MGTNSPEVHVPEMRFEIISPEIFERHFLAKEIGISIKSWVRKWERKSEGES